ncbi:MAG: lysine--tRNA ligase [Candidatus Roizmanbacteria bacterium]
MIWVDREVEKIKLRNNSSEWVDDMKTPSGRVHVGALRGVVIHDLIHKVLLENNIKSTFSYVFNDMDSMDAIPSYLDQEYWGKFAGMPLNIIPSPEKGYKSFAEYYAKEFITVFNSINCHPKILWSSEIYQAGKMNEIIRTTLNKASEIREIYLRITKKSRPDDWYPFQVTCENCNRIGTTYVYNWDGEFVHYYCKPDMVNWAKGCEYKGKVSPFNGNGKPHWKIDWPSLWNIIGITIEGSGKDHMSAGGSYDISSTIAKEVLNYTPPYAPAYEWFTIGGRKMSSSKGIGASAKDVADILPPDVFRFFIVRTPISTHLDFNPYGDTIPNIFDEYDRCLNAYFDKLENIIPEGKQGEVIADFARIMELSEVHPLPKRRIFLPRFRTIANLLQSQSNIIKMFEELKKSSLTQDEIELLEERIKYAQLYLDKFASEETRIQLRTDGVVSTLTENQKIFISLLAHNLTDKLITREDIQNIIFATIKEVDAKPKDLFDGFYQALIGKSYGPKASDLILEYGIGVIRERLFKSLGNTENNILQPNNLKNIWDDSKIFSIDSTVSKIFPSLSVGVAIIEGVTIQKNNEQISELLNDFVLTQKDLTNADINSYPEVLAYRKLYKEMGIDWHSRRPSPEALLRRIATKKDLYHINTCVDAYNLIVMQNRISIGAFDLDKIKFPTVLRFAQDTEEILLLGDTEPTRYTSRELAYFDNEGGYNIDFNYRDAQRTCVTEHTKNILINIDGIYEITPRIVEDTLNKAIEIIQKYCGGTIKKIGIALAE